MLLAALALLATALLSGSTRRRPWAAAGWALAPVLLVHWLSWELVAAVGVAVLLWGWTTGRAWLAGVGAGIGAAFALPVAVAFVGVLAVGGRLRDRVDALARGSRGLRRGHAAGSRAPREDPDIGSIWLLLEQTGVGGSAHDAHRRPARSSSRSPPGAVWWLVRRAGTADSAHRPPAPAWCCWPRRSSWRRRPRRSTRCWCCRSPRSPYAAGATCWCGRRCTWSAGCITGWYVGQALVPTIADDARAYWLAVLLRVAGLVWLVVAVLRDAVR